MNMLRAAARSVGLRRSHAAAVRLLVERHLIARRSGAGEPRSRILCYHSTGTSSWGVNDIEPGRFRRQLQLALDQGYSFVPAGTLANGDGRERDLAITFDDGLSSVAQNAAPILRELNIPWTMFVVSEWADGKHDFGRDVMLGWREIERIAAEGTEIGSHSATHADFRHLDPESTAFELETSMETIERRTGIRAKSFAIPFGHAVNWSPEAQRAATAAGYRTIYAQAEDTRPPGTVARTFVTRFDSDRIFTALLAGAFDGWEEWL